jgi:hypothetical protein
VLSTFEHTNHFFIRVFTVSTGKPRELKCAPPDSSSQHRTLALLETITHAHTVGYSTPIMLSVGSATDAADNVLQFLAELGPLETRAFSVSVAAVEGANQDTNAHFKSIHGVIVDSKNFQHRKTSVLLKSPSSSSPPAAVEGPHQKHPRSLPSTTAAGENTAVFIENENLRVDFNASTGLTSRITDKKTNITAKMTQQIMCVSQVLKVSSSF